MNVEIREMHERRVAAVRHIGPYNQIAQAFERLGAIAGQAGLLQPSTEMIAIYYDDPDGTPPDQLRSDAAISVPATQVVPNGLVEQRLIAGRYARARHVGPYEQLGDAWARFFGEWLPASGNRIGAGASYEIYVNNPTNAAKTDLITDLYIPLA
jgi:AraC family transcriptional regulator